jgi:hypothetical protein
MPSFLEEQVNGRKPFCLSFKHTFMLGEKWMNRKTALFLASSKMLDTTQAVPRGGHDLQLP